MTGGQSVAVRDALLDVLRPLLTARGTIETEPQPIGPARAAALLAEAAEALARVRAMPGLPSAEAPDDRPVS